MKAMTYRGPFRVRVDQKPKPKIEHPNDAIVRVTRAAICGSDIHLYHGLVPDTRVGTTFGHEFTGIVEDVGENVDNLQAGDHVLVPFNIACGTCFFCSRDLYSDCHNSNPNATAVGGIYGYSHTTGGYDGGQAEYVRVPFANIGPTKIPDWMDEEDALLLTDACPTGYQAAEMGDIKEGDTVVVFGAGPVGIFAARSAWLMGAGRVIVTDHLDYRLDFVRQYGPAETFNFQEVGDVVLYLKRITEYRGADVCIDAVGADAHGDLLQTFTGLKIKLQAGAATALVWAINSVRKAGTISVVGVYGPTFNLVPIGNVVNKGLTVRANQCSVKRHLPRLFEHVREGRIDPKAIITHRYALDEIAEAYEVFTGKREECIKPVVLPAA
ncbi:MAG: glutathione-dependent formaldehyde dehydrogenase [Acidobacteria bacterium]|nr:glutathione-dependent formaldehyde dehydrogenase [Acidobacteriota bacterium]